MKTKTEEIKIKKLKKIALNEEVIQKLFKMMENFTVEMRQMKEDNDEIRNMTKSNNDIMK